jgi:hypothetical protein
MATYTTVPSYPPQMDNFRSSGQSTKCQTKTQSSTGSNSPRGHVGFINNRDEEKEKRQKYLTARYGQHQMTLIRKRLAVEDWLFEQLRKLHDCKVSEDLKNYFVINNKCLHGIYFFRVIYLFISLLNSIKLSKSEWSDFESGCPKFK